MIDKIRVYASVPESPLNSFVNYNIELHWYEGAAELREVFTGENPDEVKLKAMNFILKNFTTI